MRLRLCRNHIKTTLPHIYVYKRLPLSPFWIIHFNFPLSNALRVSFPSVVVGGFTPTSQNAPAHLSNHFNAHEASPVKGLECEVEHPESREALARRVELAPMSVGILAWNIEAVGTPSIRPKAMMVYVGALGNAKIVAEPFTDPTAEGWS
jgi:hypothetical protein